MIEADDPGFYNEDEPEDSSWACKRCHRIMAVPPEVSRLCGKCKDIQGTGAAWKDTQQYRWQCVECVAVVYAQSVAFNRRPDGTSGLSSRAPSKTPAGIKSGHQFLE